MNVTIVSASPRHEGNSATLASAAAKGAIAAGHDVQIEHLDDYVQGMLRDCRTCRLASGACGIDDRYEELLLDRVLPADAIVYATPLWWYGMSGRLKTFFDRMFCYIAGSSPHAATVNGSLPGKRVGVLIASEESYQGAVLPIIGHFQELTRYLHQDLVGVVHGIGNKRGEVGLDPSDPLRAAEDLGRRLFDTRVTDYRLDTPRSNSIWGAAPAPDGNWSDDY